MANGKGIKTFSDGSKYTGDLKEDNINGQGTMTFLDGSKFVGEWKNNKIDGQGTFIWPDGSNMLVNLKMVNLLSRRLRSIYDL